MRNTLEMASVGRRGRSPASRRSYGHATTDVADAIHPAAMIGAAFVVFLLLSIASVGTLVVRFFAGLAAILGCMGLLVVILSLLLLYRVLENPLSNLALLIGTGTWAWWYTVRKHREEHDARTGATPHNLGPLAHRIGAWLTPRSDPSRVLTSVPSDGPQVTPALATRRKRQRSASVPDARDRQQHRRRHGPRP